jgi:hypothetical protein
MDPINYLTVASYNNAILRTKFLKKRSVCLLPPQGFSLNNRPGSLQAYGWLALVKHGLREAGDPAMEVRDGRHGGEVRLAGVHVDGWIKTAAGSQFALMYHGCR